MQELKTDPLSLLHRYRFHYDVPNWKGELIGHERLLRWAMGPSPELQCYFCGGILPPSSRYCPGCREYKGLVPYIPDWSDWG